MVDKLREKLQNGVSLESTVEDVRIGIDAKKENKKLLVLDVSEDETNCMQIYVKFVSKYDKDFGANFLYVKLYFEMFVV